MTELERKAAFDAGFEACLDRILESDNGPAGMRERKYREWLKRGVNEQGYYLARGAANAEGI